MSNPCADDLLQSKNEKKNGFRRFSLAEYYSFKNGSQDKSTQLRRIVLDNFNYEKSKEEKIFFKDITISEDIIISKSTQIARENKSNCLPLQLICKKSQENGFDFNKFSQQSVLCAMDRFVKCVNNMISTVLVPSKLKDMNTSTNIGNAKDVNNTKGIRNGLDYSGSNNEHCVFVNSDLFKFYNMLNEIKKELLWGNGNITNATNLEFSNPIDHQNFIINRNKHTRQPSDDSLGSLSSNLFYSDQEMDDSETDSFLTDRDSIDEPKSHLAESFRYHLQGFHTILNQLADSADYITARYQKEIDGC